MIGFAGLSHLGIVSSIAAAAKGYDVVAYDPDTALIQQLQNGELPIVEPDLPGMLSAHRERLRFSHDVVSLKSCNLVVFSLDVPTDDNNSSDLAPLSQLVRNVASSLDERSVLVILSQVPPGFTRSLARDLPGSRLFYQVETLIFGAALERAMKPERFIVGCDDPARELPDAFQKYLASFDCPILQMRYESAELAKIAINMFLIASVSMTNTLAEICEASGAEWSEIVPALRLDKRIGSHAYLTPGLGIAGGNLERDLATVRQIAREFGTDSGVADACAANSAYRKNWAFGMLHSEVLSVKDDVCVAVLGLTYKPNTASIKNSPALELIDALRPFTVRTYDPQAGSIRFRSGTVTRLDSALQACEAADAVVVATPWAEFGHMDLERVRESMAGNVFIDPYGIVNPVAAAGAGLQYFRLGSFQ